MAKRLDRESSDMFTGSTPVLGTIFEVGTWLSGLKQPAEAGGGSKDLPVGPNPTVTASFVMETNDTDTS